MQKGFSLPLILFIISLTIVGGIVYVEFSQRSIEQVRGAKDAGLGMRGFSVNISSSGPWDLYEYLCKDKEECVRSFSSGSVRTTMSGDTTLEHELVIPYSESWKDYDYIKIYVRPVWGTGQKDFLIADSSEQFSSFVSVLQQEELSVQSMIMPLEMFEQQFFSGIAEFSNL